MNFSHLAQHIAKGSVPRTVLITGGGPSAQTMVSMIREYFTSQADADHVTIQRLWPQSVEGLKTALSTRDLPGTLQAFIIMDALPLLRDADVPWLERLLAKKSEVQTVWVGELSTVTSVNVALTRSTVKVYESGFGSTDAQKKIFVQWLQRISTLSAPYAKLAAEAVDYDEDLAHALVTKASLLGADITPQALTILGQDFNRSPFVNALVRHRLSEAAILAPTVPAQDVPKVIGQLVSTVKLLGQMYPATQKFSEPGLPAARLTGVPLATLSSYWTVAGHYTPTDVVRHLMTLSATYDLASRSPHGVLLNLVLSW